jgi:hypothetical protein
VTSDNRADVIRIKGKALKEGNIQPDRETLGLRDERLGATFGATMWVWTICPSKNQ